MSKEDNISKLFRENQDAFEKEPSGDLWDKIASKLDEPIIVEKTKGTYSLIMRLSIAASFLLFMTVALVIQFNNPTVISLNLDKKEVAHTTFDSLLDVFEEDETLPVHLADLNQRQEMEDELQEKVIVEAIIHTISEEDERVEMVDKLTMEQVEFANSSNKLYEIEELLDEEVDNANGGKPFLGSTIDHSIEDQKGNNFAESGHVGYVLNDDIVSKNIQQQSNIVVEKQIAQEVQINTDEDIEVNKDVRALANYATPSSISAFNSPRRDQLKKESQDYAQRELNAVDIRMNKRSPIRFKDKKIDFYKAPSPQIHPKLKPLSWLIGKWQDNNETEGRSLEEWEVANYKTFIGRGFKYSTENDLLFKEMFKIEYRLATKQIFLRVKYIENEKFVDYMLTSYDTDQVIFQQKEQIDYPDEVIIQRNMDGYTTIITNTNNQLLPDQQRYLENRHRVSNIRAIRTLEAAEQ